MPYAADVYTAPPGTTATTLTPIDSSDYNTFVADITAAQNAARPIVAGGTGQVTALAAGDALNPKGADVATAATVNLDNATGFFPNITGTATVSAFTLAAGKMRMLRAAAVFTLTASATLIVNGSTSSDGVVAAGDLLVIEGFAGSTVRVNIVGSGSGGMSTVERRNALLRLATLAKLAAGFQRDINAFAAGFKGASDAADGVYAAGSSAYTRDSSAGCVKPTFGATSISGATGTNIGNLTGGGGLAAVFAGVDQSYGTAASKIGSGAGYVGKTYSGGKRINKVDVRSTTGGWDSSPGTVGTYDIRLYGKTGSAPSSATDGTLLAQNAAVGDPNSVTAITLTSSDQTTVFDHVWVYTLGSIDPAVYGLAIGQATFFEATANNSTVQFLQQTVDSTGRVFGVADVHPVDAMTIGTTYIVEVYTGGSWVACDVVNAGIGESGRTIVGFSKSGMTPGTTVDLRIRTVGKDHRTYRFGVDMRSAA